MRFPDFSLPGCDGAMHTRDEFAGHPLVVYFYPKDMTPGCTTQAQGFRDQMEAFATLRVPVVGISPDPVASHCRFRDKHRLPFLLLSDLDHQLAERLSVWSEKTLYGRTFLGIVRSTFLVDRAGMIVQEWRKVRVAGHVESVLAAATALAGRGRR